MIDTESYSCSLNQGVCFLHVSIQSLQHVSFQVLLSPKLTVAETALRFVLSDWALIG